MEDYKEKLIYNYCSSCKQPTRHQIHFEIDEHEEYDISRTVWQVVECIGCHNKSFRQEEHNYYNLIENEFGETDDYEIITENYPPVLAGHSELNNKYSLPEKILLVYNDTINAFKAKSFLLAGAGFRAMIEAICIHEKIKGNSLEAKIDNLSKNRLITEKEANRLHSIRFLGNDSIHEMEVPSENQLFLILEIIETLLKDLYIIDNDAKNVLDTKISEYNEFEDLLWKCVSNFDPAKETTLKDILGKHIRRINFDLPGIEKIVIRKIKDGELKFLKLGNPKLEAGKDIQYYFYTGLAYNDLPF